MSLEQLFLIVGSFALILATQVQLLKVQISRVSGPLVILLSIVIGALEGALLGSVGIEGLNSITSLPPFLSGALIGVLAGISASGGKDLVTGMGRNFAKAQAEYQPCDKPAAPPPTTPAPADDWEDVGVDALK